MRLSPDDGTDWAVPSAEMSDAHSLLSFVRAACFETIFLMSFKNAPSGCAAATRLSECPPKGLRLHAVQNIESTRSPGEPGVAEGVAMFVAQFDEISRPVVQAVSNTEGYDLFAFTKPVQEFKRQVQINK